MQMIISVCQLMKRGVTGFITPGPSRGVKLQADLLTPYRLPLIAPTATGTQYTVPLIAPTATGTQYTVLLNGGVVKGTFGTFGTAKSLALDKILG